jgi:hypothetical protein
MRIMQKLNVNKKKIECNIKKQLINTKYENGQKNRTFLYIWCLSFAFNSVDVNSPLTDRLVALKLIFSLVI